ncbi:hypothetical protein [Lysobacter sp. FW306-1B-D06B]|uniref:hypothetical protein n=1 Tax=Lysobacter sp. FW306-1B-D06B TaxID=3140250 RepID=UPI00313FE2F6
MSQAPAGAMDRESGPVPWPGAEPVVVPRRHWRWWKFALWLLSAGLSLALITGASYLKDGEVLAVLFLLVPSYWLHIVLHESGHALAGMACGMRPIAFSIGAFRFERGLSGWRWRHGGAIAGVGGFAMLLPAGGRGHRRRDAALYTLGGPLTTLAVTVAAIAMVSSMEIPSASRAFFLAIAVIGVPGVVVNLMPLTVHGWQNDGRLLLDLMLGRPNALVAQRLRAAAALSLAGVRPRDWPADMVPFDIPDTGPLRANALLMHLGWADDAGDRALADRAAAALADGFWTTPAALRPHLALALAGHAIRSGDGGAARAWRPYCDGGLLHMGAGRAWLDAALAVDAGEFEAACVGVAFARLEVARMHDIAGARILAEHLDALDVRIQRARSSSVQPALPTT